MRPPCISTISLAMARPSPVPPLARVLELSTWRNFSKIRSHSSAGIPGPVSLTLTVKWPLTAPAAMRTSPESVNLMALPTRLSSTWVRRCSSPRPMGRDFATSVFRASFLLCANDSVAARTVSTTLSMAYSVTFRVNWPDSILAMSSEAEQMLVVGADASKRFQRLLAKGLVEALLHELGIAQNGGERRPELMAHAGDELRLVMARDLQLSTLLCNFVEEPRIFQRNRRLVGEALHEADDGLRKFARLAPHQN